MTQANVRTVQGSCHCQKVRFEAEVDLRAATRCNCTICQKLGVVGCVIAPTAFRLLSPEGDLTRYPNSVGARFFCPTCGVHCFGNGHLDFLGGDFVSVNVNTLDGIEHADLHPGHFDGRHDNWMAGTRPTPWPTLP